MYVLWSRIDLQLHVGGSCACNSASFALTPSITATVLAPLWRRTSSETVGHAVQPRDRPLLLRAVLGVADVLDADRCAVHLATTMSLNSFGSAIRPDRAERSARGPGPVTLPPGTSAFWRTIASRTAVIGS